jgi:hypothetical protein
MRTKSGEAGSRHFSLQLVILAGRGTVRGQDILFEAEVAVAMPAASPVFVKCAKAPASKPLPAARLEA